MSNVDNNANLIHSFAAQICCKYISMKDIVASYKYAYQLVAIEGQSISINKLNCVKFVFCDEHMDILFGNDISFAIANCSPSLTYDGVCNIYIYAQMNGLHLNVSELVPNYPLPLRTRTIQRKILGCNLMPRAWCRWQYVSCSHTYLA